VPLVSKINFDSWKSHLLDSGFYNRMLKVWLTSMGLFYWKDEGTHGKKGSVIPTKSFVKIGITKMFCQNNKFINKTFGWCSKIFG